MERDLSDVRPGLIIALDGFEPRLGRDVFVAPTAAVIGNVTIGEESSVWFGATLRADNGANAIRIGARTSIQDSCVIHVSTDRGTIVGDDVTVGHGAILEGCNVGDRALIGMNAVVLEGAHVGEGSLVAAGSVVPSGMKIPPRVLVAGIPATVRKEVSGQSAAWIEHSAPHYVALAKRYLDQLANRRDRGHQGHRR